MSEKCLKEQQPAQQKDEAAERKKLLIKLGSMTALAAIILVFVTVAWFTMSKNVETGSMAMTAEDIPYDIITTGSNGLYDDYMASDTVKWLLTEDSNMNNLYSGEGEPDLKEITKFESEQYGLKPGDTGSLKFTIQPKTTEAFTLDPIINLKGYKATFDEDNYMVDYATGDSLTEVENEEVNTLLSTHILFFYKDSSNKMHLIPQEGFDVEVAGEDKEVTIYWAWPATLMEIFNANINGLDETASKEVRRYFFENPSYFLKTVSADDLDGLSVEKNEDVSQEEAAIALKLPQLKGKDHTKYSAMYNDADQMIGDNVQFVLAELSV